MKHLRYPFLKRSVLTLLVSSSFASVAPGATVNLHITTGGPLWSLIGIEARKPLYHNGQPAPIKAGTEDVLDCEKIAQDDCDGTCNPGTYLVTTEAGAICNAVAQVQQHIKNDVVLEAEFYFVDLTPISPGALGGSLPNVQLIVANNKSKDLNKGYKIGRKLLIAQNAQEKNSDPIVNHLPRHSQLQAILPDDPFYQSNPEFKDGKWKPRSLGITTAQLKALGIRPSVGQVGDYDEDLSLYSGLASQGKPVDFVMLLADTEAAGSLLQFDFDISMGSNPPNELGTIPDEITDMQGPYDLQTYNAIDFTDPFTWPVGFNTVIPKRAIDVQGIVMHEFIHSLGYISYIGEDTIYGGITLPAPEGIYPSNQQAVYIMDLFRIKDRDAANIRNMNDFTKAPRYWIVDALAENSEGLSHFCLVDQGHATSVVDVKNGKAQTILMTSGEYFSDGIFTGAPGNVTAGDGFQASHARNPFKSVPVPGFELEGCTVTGGGPVANGWVKQYIFTPDSEGESPPGMIMRPFTGFHNPTILTQRDLKMLDLIGWDIDYAGGQQTVLSPAMPNQANDPLVDQESFEAANGVTFVPSSKLIIDK